MPFCLTLLFAHTIHVIREIQYSLLFGRWIIHFTVTGAIQSAHRRFQFNSCRHRVVLCDAWEIQTEFITSINTRHATDHWHLGRITRKFIETDFRIIDVFGVKRSEVNVIAWAQMLKCHFTVCLRAISGMHWWISSTLLSLMTQMKWLGVGDKRSKVKVTAVTIAN